MINIAKDASVIVLGDIPEEVLVGEKLRLETLTATVGRDVNLVDQLLWQGRVARVGLEGLVRLQVRGFIRCLKVLLCLL